MDDYSRPLCNQGVDNEYSKRAWKDLELSSDPNHIKRIFCQTTYMSGSGPIDSNTWNLIKGISNAIRANPDWASNNETRYPVDTLVSELLDIAHEKRFAAMANQKSAAAKKFFGTAKEAKVQSAFMKKINAFGDRCERGDSAIQPEASPIKKCDLMEAEYNKRWKKYTSFLKEGTKESITARDAMDKLYKAADQAPFSGRKNIAILPMPANMRSAAKGYTAPIKLPDGTFTIAIYLNPEEDPLEAIATLAHEANHGAEYTAETAATYDTMNTHRPDYDRLRLSYDSLSSIDSFWPKVCMSGQNGAGDFSCEKGKCGLFSGGDNNLGLMPCSHPDGGYMSVGGNKLDQRKVVSEKNWKELEKSSRYLQYSINQYCTRFNLNTQDCNYDGVKATLDDFINVKTAGDPVNQASYIAELASLNQLRQNKKAYDMVRQFRSGITELTAFYNPSSDPDKGWNNIKRRFETARDAYLPVRRKLSRHTLASEYRAHNLTWQVMSDLTVNHPHLVCQRNVRMGNEVVPLASKYNHERNEMLCGDYMCEHLAMGYTESGEGMNENDIFLPNKWQVDIKGKGGDDDLTGPLNEEYEKMLRLTNDGGKCLKDGQTLPIQPLRYDCSAEAGKRKRLSQ